MRVHFFTTGFLRGPEVFLRPGGRWRYGDLPMTCAVVERREGLVLVDTGFGLRAATRPHEFPGRLAARYLRLRLCEEETLARRLASLGASPRDVRDVVLTHLHVDHAGGLEDFPQATVHASAAELARLAKPPYGYLPAAWAHEVRWTPVDFAPEARHGFARTRDLFGDGSVIALDAAGHTAGHTAFALGGGARPLVHAGDAVFHLDEARQRKSCLYVRLMAHDRQAAYATRDRLGDLVGAGATVVPSHDLAVYEEVSRGGAS